MTLALAVSVLIQLGVGIGAIALHAADTATPLAPSEAVDRYRQQQEAASAPESPPSASEPQPQPTAAPSGGVTAAAAGATAAPEVAGRRPPAAGVYVYLTSGWEDVDALGGSRHEYPAETTLTIVDEAGGQRVRWTALKERWEEWTTVSSPAGDAWTNLTSYHEFFGQRDLRSFTCQPNSLYVPSDQTPGTTFEMHCHDEGAQSVCTAHVVGPDVVMIGGAPVETLRLRMDTTMTGDVRGHMARDYWVIPETGLLVKTIIVTDTNGDMPTGSMRYREEVELTLKSLTPLQ